ncbi:uncharacterized protein [Spinacia oleracea]|uniref:Uncharacterized protein isoform X2 n=1 Tax=Spinacia oleracea TaxID=3562 RepID=A0A9R0I520_SPIOL|nr:uncharacterized protein LOC110782724 isoform X2 [Spinacia oleracea]
MQSGDLNKVWEIRALKRKPRQDEAKQILERIAKQVQPIMRKHNWRVKVLSEMYPKRKELLGLNVGRGIEVKLRLRRPDRELEFYSFHEVLDTMLHELCHNAHGPHNASFYQLWDQLRKECEELMSKGISGTGEGFDLPGKRLGGFSHRPPLASLRKTTLAAAENRKRLNSLLPSGPLRLGGDKNIMSALSPGQAAAMAAERRLQDEIWCASASAGLDADELGDSNLLETVVPAAASASSNSSNGINVKSGVVSSWKRSQNSDITNLTDLSNNVNSTSVDVRGSKLSKRSSGSHASSNAFKGNNVCSGAAASWKRSQNSDITNLIDLSNDVNSTSVDIRGTKLSNRSSGSHASSSASNGNEVYSGVAPRKRSQNGEITNVIDLSNNVNYTSVDVQGNKNAEFAVWTCETCTLLNPPLAPVCEACETLKPKDVSVKYKFWYCKICTLENSVNQEKCSACGEWRYTRGPPLATLPPNLGT